MDGQVGLAACATAPDDRTNWLDLFMSNRAGRFVLDGMRLTYGDDLSPSGGKLRARVTVDQLRVFADQRGHLYTCRKLAETVELDYPPEAGSLP